MSTRRCDNCNWVIDNRIYKEDTCPQCKANDWQVVDDDSNTWEYILQIQSLEEINLQLQNNLVTIKQVKEELLDLLELCKLKDNLIRKNDRKLNNIKEALESGENYHRVYASIKSILEK